MDEWIVGCSFVTVVEDPGERLITLFHYLKDTGDIIPLLPRQSQKAVWSKELRRLWTRV